METFENKNIEDAINDGLSKLLNKIDIIKDFYKTYQFHYIQYKHGLTIALRPYCNYNMEQIQKDKNEIMNPYLVAIDNLSVKKVFNNKKRFANYIMIPSITKNTQPFLDKLNEEDNLMRFVTSPPGTTIKNIKNCAFLVRDCMFIFINNICYSLGGYDSLSLQLPAEDDKVYSINFNEVKENE